MVRTASLNLQDRYSLHCIVSHLIDSTSRRSGPSQDLSKPASHSSGETMTHFEAPHLQPASCRALSSMHTIEIRRLCPGGTMGGGRPSWERGPIWPMGRCPPLMGPLWPYRAHVGSEPRNTEKALAWKPNLVSGMCSGAHGLTVWWVWAQGPPSPVCLGPYDPLNPEILKQP